MKLGKAPVKKDLRNLLLADIFAAVLPPIPVAYDFDERPGASKIPERTFSNLKYGDCVIAARAHQTLRLEYAEHNKVIGCSEQAVVKEYFKETGGEDSGLYMLDSLKLWRSVGWYTTVGPLKYFTGPHKIHAFAQVAGTQAYIKAAIYLLTGVQLGLDMPWSAYDQTTQGKTWEVTSGPDSMPGSWGGHAVTAIAYNQIGVQCITWGKKQWMTWDFLFKYCDEAYAVVDEQDFLRGETIPGIDVVKLEAYLAELKK